MTTVALSPTPILQFFNHVGQPVANGSVLTQVGAVNYPTYEDSDGNIPLPNPIPLSSGGEISNAAGNVRQLFLVPGVVYVFTIKDRNGNQINQATYVASSSNAGDVAFSQAATYPSGSVGKKLQQLVCVDDAPYNAVGDGSTDDAAAIQAALNSGAAAVYGRDGANYRCSTGITVPVGTEFYAHGFMPSNPVIGSRLTFDLSTATCVTVGGASASNGTASFHGFSVLRAAGSIPAGSRGVYVQNVYNSIVYDVNSVGHAIPITFKNNGDSLGIAAMVERIFTGHATDVHLEIDSWPEARFNQCRLGMNGSGDVNCNAYVRIKGGSTTNAADGPDGLYMQNCQFNQGVNTAATWLLFEDFLPASVTQPDGWVFNSCHVEGCTDGITSDSSWTNIGRVQLSDVIFNASGEFLALDPATTINTWSIDNFQCFGKFTLAATNQFNFADIKGYFAGAVSITGAGSSTLNIDGIYGNGLTVAGTFGGLVVRGQIDGGSFTNSATPVIGTQLIDIVPLNALEGFTPALALGGSSADFVYSRQSGIYQRLGNVVIGQVWITVSTKGSGSGQLSITGLPGTLGGGLASSGGGGVINYLVNGSGLTAAPVLLNVASGPILLAYQQGAANVSNVTDSNITNTTEIRATFSYVAA